MFCDVEEQVVIVGFVWDHERALKIELRNCREGVAYFWSELVSCAFEL